MAYAVATGSIILTLGLFWRASIAVSGSSAEIEGIMLYICLISPPKLLTNASSALPGISLNPIRTLTFSGGAAMAARGTDRTTSIKTKK